MGSALARQAGGEAKWAASNVVVLCVAFCVGVEWMLAFSAEAGCPSLPPPLPGEPALCAYPPSPTVYRSPHHQPAIQASGYG